MTGTLITFSNDLAGGIYPYAEQQWGQGISLVYQHLKVTCAIGSELVSRFVFYSPIDLLLSC